MDITYTKQGDYLIPDLKLKKSKKRKNIGKYGRMKLRYIKEHDRSFYTTILMNGNLEKYLYVIDREANKKVDFYVSQLKKQLKIDENLKEHYPMTWVGLMNDITNSAEEVVLKELIYC